MNSALSFPRHILVLGTWNLVVQCDLGRCKTYETYLHAVGWPFKLKKLLTIALYVLFS
jgi:hypothetical protein